MSDIVRDEVVFECDAGGYHFVATYLHAPKGEALIEISKEGTLIKSMLWPAYKVWNVAAHADDIAADIEEGLSLAGSDGLGGNTYKSDGTCPAPAAPLPTRTER